MVYLYFGLNDHNRTPDCEFFTCDLFADHCLDEVGILVQALQPRYVSMTAYSSPGDVEASRWYYQREEDKPQ